MSDRAPGRATLFISYSHTQRDQMQLLKKHLEGALFGRGVVWSDEAIAHGSRWETGLRGQLKHADAALLLVAPDYLASKWCRRELKIIADEQRSGRLKKVFWIQVEPSVWKGTELAEFQSWDFNLTQALSEAPDLNAQHRLIVKICEDIAADLDAVSAKLDDNLTFVRQVLVDEAVDQGLVVDSPLSKGHGAFAIVCRGRKGDEDVAIKVLRRSNLKELSEAFSDIVRARMSLENQCFIRVLAQFPVSGQHDQFHVIVEEFVGTDVKRLDEFTSGRQALAIDEIATVVRRAAEALREFHEAGPAVGNAYGLLTPRHLFFDTRGKRLLMPMASVSNFLWGALGWEQLAAWQDESPNLATYVAPEVADGQKATALTDQYMLGQLAFDMLEGGLPLEIKRPSDVRQKQPFWDDPAQTAKGAWVSAHGAFARIIFRMMKRNPAERWQSFDELNNRLLDLENESRALAKRTFHGLDGFTLENNHVFFDAFYDDFFKRSPESRRKFSRATDQSQKLMESMIAVLNYRDGNEPTSLSRVVDVHRPMGITAEELDDFRDAFLETLRAKLPRGMPSARREQVLNAWRDLFAPVVEYFKQAMPAAAAAVNEPRPAASTVADRRTVRRPGKSKR